MRRIGSALGGLGACVLAALGCGGEEPTQACVPGQIVICPCPGGHGVQTCAADGASYGSCESCDGGTASSSSTGTGGASAGGGGAGAAVGTGAAGGGGGAVGGAGGTGGGGGSSGPLVCTDLAALSPIIDFPACNVADQEQCACEGCIDDDVCFDAGQHLADDCVCPDCAADPYCSNAASCQDDGVCDPYYEGCACADCASHLLCG